MVRGQALKLGCLLLWMWLVIRDRCSRAGSRQGSLSSEPGLCGVGAPLGAGTGWARWAGAGAFPWEVGGRGPPACGNPTCTVDSGRTGCSQSGPLLGTLGRHNNPSESHFLPPQWGSFEDERQLPELSVCSRARVALERAQSGTHTYGKRGGSGSRL